MEITDKVTGKTYHIDNYDGDSGDCDYMQDVIGNAGYCDIVYNADMDRYESDIETIRWWIDYVDGMRDMTDKYDRVLYALSRIDDDDIDVEDYQMSLAYAVGSAQDCDYEQHATSSLMAIEDWIEEHVSSHENQEALLQLLE